MNVRSPGRSFQIAHHLKKNNNEPIQSYQYCSTKNKENISGAVFGFTFFYDFFLLIFVFQIFYGTHFEKSLISFVHRNFSHFDLHDFRFRSLLLHTVFEKNCSTYCPLYNN